MKESSSLLELYLLDACGTLRGEMYVVHYVVSSIFANYLSRLKRFTCCRDLKNWSTVCSIELDGGFYGDLMVSIQGGEDS